MCDPQRSHDVTGHPNLVRYTGPLGAAAAPPYPMKCGSACRQPAVPIVRPRQPFVARTLHNLVVVSGQPSVMNPADNNDFAADLLQDLDLCDCSECWRQVTMSFEQTLHPQDVAADVPTRPCPCGDCEYVVRDVTVTLKGDIGCDLHLSFRHLQAASRPDIDIARARAHLERAETLAHRAFFNLTARGMAASSHHPPTNATNQTSAWCSFSFRQQRSAKATGHRAHHTVDGHERRALASEQRRTQRALRQDRSIRQRVAH